MTRRLTGPALCVPVAVALAMLGGPSAAAATAQLRLTFDTAPSGQNEAGPWTTGCFTDAVAPADDACVVVGGAGAVTREQRPSGTTTSPAVKFPASGAGTAMLRVEHASRLNPGTADFTVSTMVKVATGEVSPGANLVQKGTFNTAGGQWKLQLDNGVPSCRIAGTSGLSVIVSWGSSIAGTGWKFVECKRRGTVLSINVANGTPVNAAADASMDITNTSDVTIGAKGTGSNNDQFHGEIDNVVLSVG
ncbi:MAG: hypothetical protein QG608_822 [Actinomycetota bacterium]|nr:hypothetical protein [Actinomycetota bacterium]